MKTKIFFFTLLWFLIPIGLGFLFAPFIGELPDRSLFWESFLSFGFSFWFSAIIYSLMAFVFIKTISERILKSDQGSLSYLSVLLGFVGTLELLIVVRSFQVSSLLVDFILILCTIFLGGWFVLYKYIVNDLSTE